MGSNSVYSRYSSCDKAAWLWAAAVEEALRTNGLVLIRVRPDLVQVLPCNKLEEYRKAGLVKTGSP